MLLWIPGPTHVREEVLRELTRPMIGHRSQRMTELLERCDPGLRLAFRASAENGAQVAVGTHSATAMMEGSLHGVGPRVLAVVNGEFSRRWSEIARILGKDTRVLEVPAGQAVTPQALADALEREGPCDAVTLVVNETSTGVQTPLDPLVPVLADHPGAMLLVDVVSAIAGIAVDFDARRIDFALAGVNKALALPPGLTVLCASERYLAQARSRPRPSWYLDPLRTIEGHVARKTPATPCVPLFWALARQLEDIGEGRTLPAAERGLRGAAAWSARFAKHARMKQRTLAWAAGHGLAPFPAPEISSQTVSCLRAGPFDPAALLTGLKARGHEIGGGYGDLKGSTFRIGHMGDHTEEGLASLLAAADEVLAGLPRR